MKSAGFTELSTGNESRYLIDKLAGAKRGITENKEDLRKVNHGVLSLLKPNKLYISISCLCIRHWARWGVGEGGNDIIDPLEVQ